MKKDKQRIVVNPVHEWEGVWYFWDEKGEKRVGSYVSKIGAEKGLEDYLEEQKEIEKAKKEKKSKKQKPELVEA